MLFRPSHATAPSLFRGQPSSLRIETLALLCSLFFSLSANQLFWEKALASRDFAQPESWLFAALLFVALTALNFLILGLLLNRWTAKPLLYLLLTATAFAAYFVSRYHVYLDPSMLRNVVATDIHEGSDLLAWAMLPHLLIFAGIPIWLVHRTRLRRDPIGKALAWRGGSLLIAALALGGSIMLSYQDLASLMRNHKEVRYLMTPGNYLYSLGRVAYGSSKIASGPRQVVGEDAQPGGTWRERKKPVLMVFVLGETARTANWGLSGYSRQTTPRLASEGVINFATVTSCGSNTEVSVPCLFSPWGRRSYDEKRIKSSQSLLDVVARSNFKVTWIDNQSGCKGVCDGVGETRPNTQALPALCNGERCLDEALPRTLEGLLDGTPENRFVVMHQMGNHGPAYFKRYPDNFRQFQPACENSDLAKCSREQIVNAYDNAILYTDHVLTETLRLLKRAEKTYDVAFIYVSDHGESLGENGLFLHGIPYAIAPDEQLKVPMVMWLGDNFSKQLTLDKHCLEKRAGQPASHDHLFHTTLGLLDIQTSVYEAEMDLSSSCRGPDLGKSR